MKFGNHCKVDDFQHQADTERVADGANGPSHVTKAGTQVNATAKAVTVFSEKAVKGGTQRSEIGRDSEKMLMGIGENLAMSAAQRPCFGHQV
jgi:hypothetical protein